MTSLRHIALGCCVLSALAGILRLFWPENGFKSVINAVLVLYILTVGVQLVHGLDWDGLVRELRSLPDGQDTADYSDYSRVSLRVAASVDAVREVLRNAGINAAVSWQNGVCVITPADPRDKPAIEALLAVNAGDLPWRFAEGCPMTARERLAPLAARLRAALADEKQRVNLLVCMGLAGLLLLAVSSWLPADSSTQSATPAAMTDSTADYAAELETRLTALISRVEGAGKTAVMVTLESGSESIYATDTDSDGSSTHVLLGSGGADGLVETVETPRVLGVAVVCEGGGSAAVQSRVTALVQALTGIGTNHITVAKMASAN